MTNEQILKKALEKAAYVLPKRNGDINNLEYSDFFKAYYHGCHGCDDFISIYEIIFSHDFAKSFFGEDLIYQYNHTNKKTVIMIDKKDGYPMWQYALQQMVLEKDPIKYLEKFL